MKHFTRFCCSFALLLLLLAGAERGFGAAVTGYAPLFLAGRDGSGTELVLIRSFLLDGLPQYLAVDPRSLVVRSLPAAGVTTGGPPGEALQRSPYLRALAAATAPPYPLQNDGAIRAVAAVAGLFLTVDLCPSGRPLERELFVSLAGHGTGKRPAPVALAVSGRWLRSHQDELRWLRGEVAAGRLAITWVNHSFSHPYDPTLPLGRNFLLTAGIDLDREILATEQFLLEEGMVPSPFFRFPGLVSDQRSISRLAQLGLIPVGSDAWLAKGEMPREGSFILVHGNGNEPAGIRHFLQLQREGRLFPLLPLSEAFRP